jgi:hypothetical protein
LAVRLRSETQVSLAANGGPAAVATKKIGLERRAFRADGTFDNEV